MTKMGILDDKGYLFVGTDDCGTTETLNLKIPDQLLDDLDPIKLCKSLVGRWVCEVVDGKDILRPITYDNYRDFIGKQVRIRSPIFCKSSSIVFTTILSKTSAEVPAYPPLILTLSIDIGGKISLGIFIYAKIESIKINASKI